MTTATQSQLYSAKTLTDRKVVNRNGDHLGEIQDLVIDTSRGCISYAVLSFSTGFLNLSHKYFAVPWEAIAVDTAHRDLILDASQEQLESAPGFDKDNWPSQPDDTFARTLYEHYGYEYPPQGPSGQGGMGAGQGGSMGQGEGMGQGGVVRQGQQGERPDTVGQNEPNQPNRW